MTFFINKAVLLIVLAIGIMSSCGNSIESSNDSDKQQQIEKYTEIGLYDFKLNGISLITTRDSLIIKWGMPNKESSFYFSSDTITTLYYFMHESEVSFRVKKDSVIFSKAMFEDDSLVIKNSYANFSNKTKLHPMVLLFPESFDYLKKIDNKKTIHVKLNDVESAWLRLEFLNDNLKVIHFDYAHPEQSDPN
ncbi:MAG: hypothetical protein OEW75_16335 [Cyclobacteriaceae bacterium]|nr:hypothetical protein [Cyclobacteriaceae bacterium]